MVKVNCLSTIAATFVVASFTLGTVFNVAAPAFGQQTVTCESNNRERNACSIDTRDSVRLVRQLSATSCQGNWGYGRGRVWVRNGCRANFLTGSHRDNRSGRADRYRSNNRYSEDNSPYRSRW